MDARSDGAMIVVLTMLAVESFDPRLIWDGANARGGADRQAVAGSGEVGDG
jgi:uncharacterized paraquat-inducible protein A